MIIAGGGIPNDAVVHADICVVGGGAAGITLARELAAGNRSIVVVAGGGRRDIGRWQDLYAGTATPPGTHEPLHENRRRVWGGSTTVWGGRCIPYEPVDFHDRPWIAHSGWPVGWNEVSAYLARACDVCDAGPCEFDARVVFRNAAPEILPGIDGEELESWRLERWSPPTNFAKRYEADLARSDRVKVMLDAHAIHLEASEAGRSIESVLAAYSGERRFRIRARAFVLAAGGLENPRLLLASNSVVPSGIGNDRDVVGRYYQSHRFGVCGEAVLKDPADRFNYDFERDGSGVYCRRRFRLSDVAQTRYRVGNAIAFFARPGAGAAVHRNAVFSSVHLSKSLLRALAKGPMGMVRDLSAQRRDLFEHLKVIMADGPGSAPDLFRLAVARFASRRRLPSILPLRRYNRFYLYYQTEHAPNPDSRLVLSGTRDSFGMPRLDVRVAFSAVDFDTVRVLYEVFSKRFEASGVGRFSFDQDTLEHQLDPSGAGFNSNAHHIGTTRMHDSPSEGVVDATCRVHGVTNLFVAGSSVFPTSSHANPTLMIVALTLRLADHLKAKVLEW